MPLTKYSTKALRLRTHTTCIPINGVQGQARHSWLREVEQWSHLIRVGRAWRWASWLLEMSKTLTVPMVASETKRQRSFRVCAPSDVNNIPQHINQNSRNRKKYMPKIDNTRYLTTNQSKTLFYFIKEI